MLSGILKWLGPSPRQLAFKGGFSKILGYLSNGIELVTSGVERVPIEGTEKRLSEACRMKTS